VGEAGDGAEAVAIARTQRPDVVVMDVRMPVMDGITATRHITDAHLPCRVLILTTFDEDKLVTHRSVRELTASNPHLDRRLERQPTPIRLARDRRRNPRQPRPIFSANLQLTTLVRGRRVVGLMRHGSSVAAVPDSRRRRSPFRGR
jgi:CheY-like chemotaxis protein